MWNAERDPGAGPRVVAGGFTITESASARFGGHDVGEFADSADFSVRSTEGLSGYGATSEDLTADHGQL